MAISNVGEFPLIYPRERPLSDDPNQIATMAWNQFMYLLSYRKQARTNINTAFNHETASLTHGFFGTGFQVIATGVGMALTMRPGIGIRLPADPADYTTSDMNGAQGASDLNAYKLVNSASSIALTTPTADATNERLDIVEVKWDRDFSGSTSRDVFDPSSLVFTPTLLSKLADMTLALGDVGYVTSPAPSTTPIGYKTGVPAGSPVEPTVTTGYTKVATIRVPATTTTVLPEHVIEQRNLLYDGGVGHFAITFRLRADGALSPASQILACAAPPGLKLGAYISNAAPAVGASVIVTLDVASPAGTKIIFSAATMEYTTPNYVEATQLDYTITTVERDYYNGTTLGYTIMPSSARFAVGQVVTECVFKCKSRSAGAFSAQPIVTISGFILPSIT